MISSLRVIQCVSTTTRVINRWYYALPEILVVFSADLAVLLIIVLVWANRPARSFAQVEQLNGTPSTVMVMVMVTNRIDLESMLD